MKLAQLFSVFPHLRWGNAALAEVTGIHADSRTVEKGSVFVALKGTTSDGHQFIAEVCQKGVVAVVVEDEAAVPVDFAGAVLKVAHTKTALHQLASRFYGEPSEKMYCVGVTGTNGKSTITYMVEAIFQKFGWSTGVIGTIGHHLGERKWATELTTPDTLTLHKRIAEFAALGARAVCMEVSSIALEQNRIAGLSFDAVVFTNLTRDHLDYHQSMEAYFQCKQKLFNEVLEASKKNSCFAVINGDDPFGKKLSVADKAKVWFYGRHDHELGFKIVRQNFSGVQVHVRTPNGEGLLSLPFPGMHNVYNAMAAIGVGLSAGVSLEKCLTALEELPGVPGRLERVANERGIHIFVDYAHTSDALENVLNALRAVREYSVSQQKIITVFGCGGNRDKGKRPLMGGIADRLSDLVFVTSDNPREEEPMAIIGDILTGIGRESLQSRVFVEMDRKVAISRALNMARPEDVVLIAGKGHEDYQIIGKQKYHFSDVETVKEVLACQKV